jgi:hypothetical protein
MNPEEKLYLAAFSLVIPMLTYVTALMSESPIDMSPLGLKSTIMVILVSAVLILIMLLTYDHEVFEYEKV